MIEHAVGFDDCIAKKIRANNQIIVPTAICAFATCKDIKLSLITPEELHEIYEPWLQSIELGLPLSIQNGLMIGAGTDAGFPPVEFDSIHDEMYKLVQLGASNLIALQSATKIAAQACGLENDLGDLSVGKIADILILRENPLEDILNTRKIENIIKDGSFVL